MQVAVNTGSIVLICKISGVTVLNHKRSNLHSIFQISISQIMKCAQTVGFKIQSQFTFVSLSCTIHCLIIL